MSTDPEGRRRDRGGTGDPGGPGYRRRAVGDSHGGERGSYGAQHTNYTDEAVSEQDRYGSGRRTSGQAGTAERRSRHMPDGERGDPAFVDVPDGSDQPGHFDISTLSGGLYGGPAADLIGDSGGPHHGRPQPPRPRMSSHSHELEPHPSQPAPPRHAPRPEPDEHDSGSLVRPYARTGGRTRSDYDLALEALVSTSERGRRGGMAVLPEHRSICGLCEDARSVAEIAAHLRVPLGVARVLIGDMAGMGLVMVHESGMVMGDRPSMDFLERVLSGLRRL